MAAISGAVRLRSPSHSYYPTSFRKIDSRHEQSNVTQKPCTLLITNHWEILGKSDKQFSQFPVSLESLPLKTSSPFPAKVHATLKRPKGFGPSRKKTKNTKKKPGKDRDSDKEEEEMEEEEDDEDDSTDQGIIPEVVTNRMMNRMAVSVGAPLFIGLLFFPFFYYLKVGLKIDVPTWVPFIVSFFFFGSALLGVSYGIVSSSWDPLREGSLLGWNEAQKNWPVFWQSLRGRSGKKK